MWHDSDLACWQGAVNFALMMSQMDSGCPVDYNTITDLFLQVHLEFTFIVLMGLLLYNSYFV